METEQKISVFDKLNKKFSDLKVKELEKKAADETKLMSERFEVQVRNFENTVYNSTLYNVTEPIKEMPLVAVYSMANEAEEFIYAEYFRSKYPYSSVTVQNKQLKIVLLDEDREKFLYKYKFGIEIRQLPETYFTPLK